MSRILFFMETTRTEKLTALINRINAIDTTVRNDTMNANGDRYLRVTAKERASWGR